MNTLEHIVAELDQLTPEPPGEGVEPTAVAELGADLVARRRPLLDRLSEQLERELPEHSDARLRQKLVAIQDRHNRWLGALQAAQQQLSQKLLAVRRLEDHEETLEPTSQVVDMEI